MLSHFPLLGLLILGTMASASVVIPHTHPLIYFHGRWDSSPGTWWAGSGFKLHVNNLKSLNLTLGPHTTAPLTSVGVSLDYGEFITANISEGANAIDLPESFIAGEKTGTTVVRINVEGWQNNRMNLESIVLNEGASLVQYIPSDLVFQFIGDSLSAGQFLPKGVDQAWPFLVGEAFKAEHVVNAQPGAALTDIVSYGNEHGVSFQFFRTEDTGYFYTTDHNFTTPWNFARDKPAATHLVIHIGANDASQNVTDSQFVEVYTTFIARLRTIYLGQPIFLFTPWGWPNPDGTVNQYYEGQYEKIVDLRHAAGDENIFLVNTTGWVGWDDVFPDNQHPTVPGHVHIAEQFQAWLENRGLHPRERWATQ
ncbi:SGNH hydrolase-type esterase domain-containing protein [Roridomyces roridus]|uniref:SGNH hydrolase-type esterase domain-containing protein n=1 Tax=Roridomyces roridus TaxID=1738132 RepID=A0AAD7BBU5_9AGAR|nr:SGNH hydrolase-type esterase domain-containing protein [Roridomyces roridus]